MNEEGDQDRLIAYFGYGSLVNLATLRTPYTHAAPARLAGWRRHWQGRPSDINPLRALLSVHEDSGCEIAGMLVVDKASSLPHLDERERHYVRVPLMSDRLAFNDGHMADIVSRLQPDDLFVYVGRDTVGGKPPLLQSYLHTVMDGFLAAHGEEGLVNFLQTTRGFDREIIEDLHAPHYPRMTDVPVERRSRFDEMLSCVGVRFAGKTGASAEAGTPN